MGVVIDSLSLTALEGPVAFLELSAARLLQYKEGALESDQPKGTMHLSMRFLFSGRVLVPVEDISDYRQLRSFLEQAFSENLKAIAKVKRFVPEGLEITDVEAASLRLYDFHNSSMSLIFEDGRQVVFYPDNEGVVDVPVVEDWMRANPKVLIPGRDAVRM